MSPHAQAISATPYTRKKIAVETPIDIRSEVTLASSSTPKATRQAPWSTTSDAATVSGGGLSSGISGTAAA